MRKSEILMFSENLNGYQIWSAGVIDEPSDVAIFIGVNAKSISILELKKPLGHFIPALAYFEHTRLSKSKRYESSLVSASESEMTSPMYSQTKAPLGISLIARTPQPMPSVLNTWSLAVMPCWMTRLWQTETLQAHISLHSKIMGGSL